MPAWPPLSLRGDGIHANPPHTDVQDVLRSRLFLTFGPTLSIPFFPVTSKTNRTRSSIIYFDQHNGLSRVKRVIFLQLIAYTLHTLNDEIHSHVEYSKSMIIRSTISKLGLDKKIGRAWRTTQLQQVVRLISFFSSGEGKNRRLSFPLFFKVKIMAR